MKRKFHILAPLALLLMLLALSGCEKKAAEEAKPAAPKPGTEKSLEISLQETRLAEIPDGYDKSGPYNFSSDGKLVFYRARQKGKYLIVINNSPGKSYDAIDNLIVFSPDKQKIAYDGKRGGKEYLVINNKEVKSYENVAPGSFSPDGSLLASEVEDKREKKWFVVVSDGEKELYRSPAFPDTFRRPVFSPDGRLLVYELGEEGRKRTVFFYDLSARKIIKKHSYTDCGQAGKVSFPSDSSRVMYEIMQENENFFVLRDFASNKERTVKLPQAQKGMSGLSPDGTKIFYIANRDERHYLVVSPWESPEQGKGFGPYDALTPPIFGPDSTTFAYHSLKKGIWIIVVEDKEGAGYDAAGETVFSPDGARLAFPAMKKGKWVLAVCRVSRPRAVREGPAYDMVVTPVFSPDGKYIAYRARKGSMENPKRFIVIADAETGKTIKEGRVGDEIWPPVWSADCKSAAYGARHGRELWWQVERIE